MGLFGFFKNILDSEGMKYVVRRGKCGKSLFSLMNSFASCTCALVSTAPSRCIFFWSPPEMFSAGPLRPLCGTSPQMYIQMEKKNPESSIPLRGRFPAA